MKIKTTEFVLSVAQPSQLPQPTLPEIAFAGKSNVGKSTLINSLLNRKNLVKTSSTPGKTRLLNFFLINQKFHLVDLPGYGYAKVSRSMKEEWSKLIENYLSNRSALKVVILIIDIRHGPNEGDLQLKQWLDYYQIPSIIVANKVDKLKRNEIVKQLKKTQEALQLTKPPIQHSSLKRIGRNEIWLALTPFLGLSSDDNPR